MPHPASAPTDRLGGGRGLRVLAALVAGGMLTLVASPALAAEGSIDHVDSHDGTVQVLYSTPDGAEPALDTLQVQLDGKPLEASATLASDATDAVRRTAVLAIDVSDSMQADGKFVEAKRAAQIFLASVPTDLYVGIVTFAGKVQVVQRPTLDRAASRRLVGGLRLSHGTLLYDGLRQAVALGGKQGQRSVIVLSDGRDTSRTRLSAVTDQIKRADTKVDVVALAQSAREKALLSPLSTAGHGAVISANDPKALGRVFASEARSLAQQIQITAKTPAGAGEGTLSVSVSSGDQSYTDDAYVTLSAAPAAAPPLRRPSWLPRPRASSPPPG